MEILKFKWGGGRKALTASLISLIVLVLVLSVSVGGNLVAYADNSDIGQSGGAIEIADVTENKVSATFSNKEQGVKLKITLPLASTDVYFAYEVDSSEQVWAINGSANIDKDIPYIKHEGAVEKFEVPSTTLMDKVVSSWTEITEIYEKRVFFIELHYNGTLYVKCRMSGEEEMLSATSIIKDIDNLAPSIQKGNVTHGKTNSEGKFVFEMTSTFVDTGSTGMLSSARCGLKEILIIRTDNALDEMNEESLAGEGVERICAWELLSPLQALLTQKVTFTIDKDGYYYYFVVDRVGNLNIGMLLGGKFERENYSQTDDRFLVHDSSAGTTGATFSVKDYMTVIGQELDNYAGKVNSKVYTDALESYSALLLRFYSGASDSDLEGVSKEWFSFFKNEYTAFRNAYSVGATYDISLVNGDLLNCKIGALNLNKDVLPSLGGDQVVAEFIVAKYGLNELPGGVNVGYQKGYAYKLSYKLSVSGVVSSVPKTPITYEILSIPSEVKEFTMVKKVGDKYVECVSSKGANWLRFSTDLNGEEFYLIYSVEEGGNLLPLWISLGVVGGVIVVLAVVYVVLLKCGKLPEKLRFKSKKAKVEEKSEENVEVKEEKPVPKNKKKSNKSKK